MAIPHAASQTSTPSSYVISMISLIGRCCSEACPASIGNADCLTLLVPGTPATVARPARRRAAFRV